MTKCSESIPGTTRNMMGECLKDTQTLIAFLSKGNLEINGWFSEML